MLFMLNAHKCLTYTILKHKLHSGAVETSLFSVQKYKKLLFYTIPLATNLHNFRTIKMN